MTDVEKQLQQIWGGVLEVPPDQISMTDNFFDIGGNSLLLMQLQNRVAKTTVKPIGIESFFQYPTIKAYAAFLADKGEDKINLKPLMERSERLASYRNKRKGLRDK
jgi:aryl carrier-like protein